MLSSIANRADAIRITLRLLVHNRWRTLVATAGIAFSILFMFIQLGFYGAVDHTATSIVRALDADVILLSPRYVHLLAADSIDRRRLFQVLADPEVESATPFYVRNVAWKASGSGDGSRAVALAFDPERITVPLRIPTIAAQRETLRRSNTILVDTLSQPKCGPLGVGVEPEIEQHHLRIGGHFQLGVGFLAEGALVLSESNLVAISSGRTLEEVTFGLVKLRPGADPKAAAARIGALLPPDTRVVTHAALVALQQRHWVRDTAFGNIFAMGTILGFLVGLVVLYQVLSTDVANQLPQYATLKAMGYSDGRLLGLVLQQAFAFVVLGFVPGLLLAIFAYGGIQKATFLPMAMSPARAVGVFILCVAMSAGSGLFAARRLRSVDPAELFA